MTFETPHSISKNYFSLSNESKKNQLDPWYGDRKLGDKFMIGKENIRFKDNAIGLRNVKYAMTEGLMQLLFRNDPNKDIINQVGSRFEH